MVSLWIVALRPGRFHWNPRRSIFLLLATAANEDQAAANAETINRKTNLWSIWLQKQLLLFSSLITGIFLKCRATQSAAFQPTHNGAFQQNAPDTDCFKGSEYHFENALHANTAFLVVCPSHLHVTRAILPRWPPVGIGRMMQNHPSSLNCQAKYLF